MCGQTIKMPYVISVEMTQISTYVRKERRVLRCKQKRCLTTRYIFIFLCYNTIKFLRIFIYLLPVDRILYSQIQFAGRPHTILQPIKTHFNKSSLTKNWMFGPWLTCCIHCKLSFWTPDVFRKILQIVYSCSNNTMNK